MLAQLTEDEAAEFTLFNLIAFDAHRVECRNRGEVAPCWLCLNENAKSRIREAGVAVVADLFGRPAGSLDIAGAELLVTGYRSTLMPALNRWVAAERSSKAGRAKFDPQAEFAHT